MGSLVQPRPGRLVVAMAAAAAAVVEAAAAVVGLAENGSAAEIGGDGVAGGLGLTESSDLHQLPRTVGLALVQHSCLAS